MKPKLWRAGRSSGARRCEKKFQETEEVDVVPRLCPKGPCIHGLSISIWVHGPLGLQQQAESWKHPHPHALKIKYRESPHKSTSTVECTHRLHSSSFLWFVSRIL